MPIPTAAANILVEVLKVAAYHLGERLAQNVVYHHSPQAQYSSSLVPVEQVKSDPRYVQAQVEYLKRKYVRDSEFLLISAVQGKKGFNFRNKNCETGVS